MPEAVLVTGASGFVGRNVITRLSEEQHVIAASRRRLDLPDVDWVPLDLAEPSGIEQLPRGVDTVLHLAADIDASGDRLAAVNSGATTALVDWSRRNGVRRFVFASTGSVYGGGRSGCYSEDDALPPLSALTEYAASKLTAERACQDADGLVTVVLRLFFPYGLGQDSRRLVPRLCQAVLHGTPITLRGDDGPAMNPVHISDVVAAMVAALALERSTTMNIAGPEVTTIGQIARLIASGLGRTPVFDRHPDLSPNDLVASTERMACVLHPPTVTLPEGLSNMLAPLRGR